MSKDVEGATFRLDVTNKQLLRGTEEVSLRKKIFDILCYLLDHRHKLVTKEQLSEKVWGKTRISEEALRSHIKALRQALGDDARNPRFIRTVHGSGYCFIGSIEKIENVSLFRSDQHSLIVGRQEELGRLNEYLEEGLRGKRKVVFVTGEAGIGKTAVVEAFLKSARADRPFLIIRGQCFEQRGSTEAYFPMLEALVGFLQKQNEPFIKIIEKNAPTWLAQMPAILESADFLNLQRKVRGTTQGRMLREMADALEAITAHQPLILVLEDLHWCDPSTADLLAAVARRKQQARLLIIGTHRPLEMGNNHPLQQVKQELQLHGLCEEIPLAFLDEEQIVDFLTKRFGESQNSRELANVIYRHTGGNPLFMVTFVDDMIRTEIITEKEEGWQIPDNVKDIELGIPEELNPLIEKQLGFLSTSERKILELGSVAGVEFTVATLAASTKDAESEEDIEEICEELANRRLFLQAGGSIDLPDGTVSGQYRFRHTLYRNSLYRRIGEARRINLHRQIGVGTETVYGDEAEKLAVVLAMHFKEGRDTPKALKYFIQAARNAVQISAHKEALLLLDEGMRFLGKLRNNGLRIRQELEILLTRSASLTATEGYSSPEVEGAYKRARDLCGYVENSPQIEDVFQLFRVLRGLWAFYLIRGEFHEAKKLGEQLLTLAQRNENSDFSLEANQVMGVIAAFTGELVLARKYLEQGFFLYDQESHFEHTAIYGGADPGVVFLSISAWTLWALGYPEQAKSKSREALNLAENLGHPFSRAFALLFGAGSHLFRREGQLALEQASVALTISYEYEFPLGVSLGKALEGWAKAEQGQIEKGIAQIQQGLEDWQANGGNLLTPCFLAAKAEGCGRIGRSEEGFELLNNALDIVSKNGQSFYEAELYRLKGEVLLNVIRTRKKGQPQITEAEQYFLRAFEIAQQQDAKSLELRAAMSLYRLRLRMGKSNEAYDLLTPVYHWFTEGFDTPDLIDAKALLAGRDNQAIVAGL